MSTPNRLSPPRPGIPPRPLSVPPSAITLPSTPVSAVLAAAPPAPAAAPAPQALSGSWAPSPSWSTAPAQTHDPLPVAPAVPMDLLAAVPLSRDWYVYQADGRHIGPVSTSFLARGWLSRQVPQDVYVGAAGDPSWRPISQVAEIMDAVRAFASTPA